jgi:non-canonical purine NTP pyrophosphatase (RdgB/HAM1 family)
MNDLVFVTGNMHKLHWVEKFIGYKLEHQELDIDEIQSLDTSKVLEHKAKSAFEVLKKPVLVEDTSLVFNAWGKLPGPFIKFFLQELGEGDGLSRLLEGFEDKRITQSVSFGLYDGKVFKIFEASSTGLLVDPRVKGTTGSGFKGTTGFGFDKVFYDEAQGKTRSEMTEEEYGHAHPRKAAVMKLAKYLELS